MRQPTTIYLRQAGLTYSSKFCYLYCASCVGQDAVSKPRPIANIHVGCHFSRTDQTMKEKTLRDYLDNKVTVDILALDVRDSQKKTSYDVISVFVDKTNETGEYEITKDHLIKLLDDTITGRLTTTDLNTIAFALIGSEYFTWDKDDKVIDDCLVLIWVYTN